MDFQDIMAEAIGGGLIGPLISILVLPILYRIVGVTKRERREREEVEMRLNVDLARGLEDLSHAARDPDEQAYYDGLRRRVLADFRDQAQRHFDSRRELRERPELRYWLLPPPKGIFGVVWSAAAIISLLFELMIIAGIILAIVNDKEGQTLGLSVAGVIIIAIFAAPLLLFRFLAFRSARIAAKREAAVLQAGRSRDREAATAFSGGGRR